MFKITDGKGFYIDFPNGYGVSVQFGPGNYCDHYDRRIGRDEAYCGRVGSETAEVAVISKDGEFVQLPGESDDVIGRCSSTRVLEIMQWAAKQ